MDSRVITFHYTLQDKDGEVLDSSRDGDPLPFLEGVRQIVPGLESELVKMAIGERRKVTVASAQGYGPHHAQLIQKVNRAEMPGEDIQVGDRFEAGNGEQTMIVTVTALDDQHVTLDGNHPLAGQDLFFDVEVTAIRPATSEELTHGHVHGAGGHHH
jgi:FKBP-type peptidyl-prolyl cis-trans isomerase SlyD